MPDAAAILALALPALTLTAAATDVVSFRIPNWISLALVAVFPLWALAAGVPLATFGLHVAVGAAALIAGMVMFQFRWIGGGDAKLFAAAALWLGWPMAATFALAAGLVGGVLAMALLTLRSGALRPLAMMGPRWMARLAEPGENVPYGVAIAAGALMAYAASPLGKALGF